MPNWENTSTTENVTPISVIKNRVRSCRRFLRAMSTMFAHPGSDGPLVYAEARTATKPIGRMTRRVSRRRFPRIDALPHGRRACYRSGKHGVGGGRQQPEPVLRLHPRGHGRGVLGGRDAAPLPRLLPGGPV